MRSVRRIVKVWPASPPSGDAGFTMIEVIVALLLIGAAMLSVLTASTSGVVFQGVARQRETAIGLANQAMEELRSLPTSALKAGLNANYIYVDRGDGNCWHGRGNPSVSCPSSNTVDPHIMFCRNGPDVELRLFSCTRTADLGSGEPIVTHECSGGCSGFPPLVYPGGGNTGSQVIDGVTYYWRAYITRASSSQPYRLTVTVDWSWRGKIMPTTRLQSLAAFPSGCISNQTHFVNAPCAGGVSGGGGGGLMKVDVRWLGPNQTPWTLSFGSILGSYTTEQSTELLGTATLLNQMAVTVVRDNNAPESTFSEYVSKFSTSSTSTADWRPSSTTLYPDYLIAASADQNTYPRVEAYFDVAGGNGSSGPVARVTAAVTNTGNNANACGDGTASVPCLYLENQSNSGSYAISIRYRASESLSFPLLRLAPTANGLWTESFKFKPFAGTGGGTLVTGGRILESLFFGGRTSACEQAVATQTNSEGVACSSWLSTSTNICDAIAVKLVESGGDLTATDQTPGSCTSGTTNNGYRRSGSPAFYGNSTNCTSTATAPVTPPSPPATGATAFWCYNPAGSTSKRLWRLSGLNWTNSSRTQDGKLSFQYQVFSCPKKATDNNDRAWDNRCLVYNTTNWVASSDTPDPIYVDVTFPRLTISPSDYDYW